MWEINGLKSDGNTCVQSSIKHGRIKQSKYLCKVHLTCLQEPTANGQQLMGCFQKLDFASSSVLLHFAINVFIHVLTNTICTQRLHAKIISKEIIEVVDCKII